MNIRIAIQGERGAFSEAAARKLFGAAPEIVPCRTFDDAFAAVQSRSATAAVIPIENSLAGSVMRSYELLGEAKLEIAGEVLLRIGLSVIARPGVALASLRRVLSHPVALAQCQRFFAAHRDLEAIVAYDTAGSVKLMMEGDDASAGAIAGTMAAELYGAGVVAANIEDNPENYTRFVAIAAPDEAARLRALLPAGALKTTVLFRTPNTPGALFRALAVFALRDINLTKLESRPIAGRPWEYAFYVDLTGGESDLPIANALRHLREMCEVIVLGSYPAAAS